MARPALYEQAKSIRLNKGLTQAEAAKRFGKSQSTVANIESGNRGLDDEREYLNMLKRTRPSRKRTPGGDLKAGRLRERHIAARRYQGERLLPQFKYPEDYQATLPVSPEDDGWKIVGICRASKDTEIGFAFEGASQRWGLMGFHLINGQIKRGRIIVIDEEYDPAVELALDALSRGDFDEDDAGSQEIIDDGILSDNDESDANA